jgi:hypothetical protein
MHEKFFKNEITRVGYSKIIGIKYRSDILPHSKEIFNEKHLEMQMIKCTVVLTQWVILLTFRVRFCHPRMGFNHCRSEVPIVVGKFLTDIYRPHGKK